MSKCQNCGVKVANNSNCPLCGKYLGGDIRSTLYPSYFEKHTLSAKRILRFIFWLIVILSVFLDLFIGFEGWSITVSIAAILIWIIIFKPIFGKRAFGVYAMYDVVSLSALSLWIDYKYSGMVLWSVDYVISAIIGVAITVILISATIRKNKWSEVNVYLISLAFMNLIILILGWTNVHTYNGLALIIAVYSVITIIAMRYFLKKAFYAELKRVFHL